MQFIPRRFEGVAGEGISGIEPFFDYLSRIAFDGDAICGEGAAQPRPAEGEVAGELAVEVDVVAVTLPPSF